MPRDGDVDRSLNVSRRGLRVFWWGALALLMLAGCAQQAAIDQLAPQEETAFAKAFVSQIAASDFEAAESRLAPALRDPQVRSKLQQVAAQFPPGAPLETRVVGAFTFKAFDVDRFDLTFEYRYPSAWFLANVNLERRNGNLAVTSVHVSPLADSLENINRFTFAGKSVGHYVVFVLTVAIAVLVLVALVLCIRTPIPRRKWAWLIFVCVGVMQWSFNWTTGALDFSPVYVSLLGAGFSKAAPAAPYIVHFGAPIGAVVFLLRRRHWLRTRRQAAMDELAKTAPNKQDL